MSLHSFIERRRKELGMTQEQLEERSSVSHMTFIRIKAGGQIMPGTKQRLAEALQCTIGDLQAAIAEQDVEPLGQDQQPAELKAEDVNWKAREKAEQDAVAKAVQAETEAYAEPEEKEKVLFVPHSKQDDVLATAELIEKTDQLSRRRYRQELKDLLLEAAANNTLGEHELGDMYADFGWAVVNKMAAEEIEMTV